MFNVRFTAFNGISYTLATDVDRDGVIAAVKARLRRARKSGQTVERIGKLSWEIQFDGSGVGDNEGVMTVSRCRYPNRIRRFCW